MDADLMKEVEQEINKILNKNKHYKPQEDEFCNGKNLETCLKQIFQELDYLDVSCMEDPFDISNSKSIKHVLVQLVNSTYNLVKLHRESQKQQSDSFEKNARLLSDFKTLSRTVDTLKKELALKDKQLQQNKEKIYLDRLENDELKTKVNNSKKEIITIKKDIAAEKNRHKHEMHKVVNESHILQERFKKNCGDYISTEGHIVEVIDSYKKNEEKHLNMIKKLQQNNHLLLEEILVLKAELAEVSFKHRSE